MREPAKTTWLAMPSPTNTPRDEDCETRAVMARGARSASCRHRGGRRYGRAGVNDAPARIRGDRGAGDNLPISADAARPAPRDNAQQRRRTADRDPHDWVSACFAETPMRQG